MSDITLKDITVAAMAANDRLIVMEATPQRDAIAVVAVTLGLIIAAKKDGKGGAINFLKGTGL